MLSATLFFNLKGGQSGSRPGILTFTLAKQVNEWKVESQAWARELKYNALLVPDKTRSARWRKISPGTPRQKVAVVVLSRGSNFDDFQP